MNKYAIGGGAYEERIGDRASKPTGRYFERPRGETWRLMRGVAGKREAIKQASSRDPKTIGRKFAVLADLYIRAGCPHPSRPRTDDFVQAETERVKKLVEYFGTWASDKMGIADLPGYRSWRAGRVRNRCSGNRTVDKDTQTLSNIFKYAVVNELFPTNPFQHGRPRYQYSTLINHSRKRAPQTADNIHAVGSELLSKVETEVAAWWLLFDQFSGCRISELLRLRLDAQQLDPETFQPGFITWFQEDRQPGQPLGLLHLGQRNKRGINPEVIIGLEFADMLAAFENWHRTRYLDSPWYFPNLMGNKPICRRAVYRYIIESCRALQIKNFTPHGIRSFYVTKRRSDGIDDVVIANEIGDKTVSLMQDTYGKRPPSWIGGELLRWIPKKGEPAWTKWKRENIQKIDFSLTIENPNISGTTIESRSPVWRNGRRTGLKIMPHTTPIKLTVTLCRNSLGFQNQNIADVE